MRGMWDSDMIGILVSLYEYNRCKGMCNTGNFLSEPLVRLAERGYVTIGAKARLTKKGYEVVKLLECFAKDQAGDRSIRFEK